MSFKNQIHSRLFRNYNRNRGYFRQSTKHRRACMESLEPRLCLNGTAEIQGYWTVEGDAIAPYCSGIVIFLDADADGMMDEGEDFRVTNGAGAFHFTGVEAGTYRVTQLTEESISHFPDFEYSYMHEIGEGGLYKTVTVSEGQIVTDVLIEPNTLHAVDKADVFSLQMTREALPERVIFFLEEI